MKNPTWTDDVRSRALHDTEWPAAYSTWPVQSEPTWSLEDARHRGSAYVPGERSPLPAWSSFSESTEYLSERVESQPPRREAAIRAARARALTDPLGARGFRQTRQRVRRETSARRRVFAGSIAIFATCFGLILHSNSDDGTSDVSAEVSDSAFGGSAAALLVIDPTGTPTPSPTSTATTAQTAALKLKTATTRAASTSEPTGTATPKPTRTPQPTATATEEAVQQAQKSHTQSKSS